MVNWQWKALAREAGKRRADCPDEETLRFWVERRQGIEAIPQRDWNTIETHLDGCSRCVLEVDEIRDFFTAPAGETDSQESAARERILEGLKQTLQDPASAQKNDAAHPAKIPANESSLPWGFSFSGQWLYPVAAILVVGVGLALFLPGLRDSTPTVPFLDSVPGTIRGTELPHPVSPRGEQAVVPGRFHWETETGQTGPWVFRLVRVDGEEIWSTETAGLSVTLPEPVRGRLRAGSSYEWTVHPVEAPARQAKVPFRILP